MPVITAQNRGVITATTEDSYRAPHRTLMANTKSQSIMTPFSAPDSETEAPKTTEESGQTSITKEDSSKSQEAVTLSPQLTALARREQKFRQQEQAFKAKQADFEAKQAEVANLSTLKSKIAAKDFSALEELGVSYDEYTNYLLNKGETANPEVQAVNELREEINSLKNDQKKNEEKQFEQIKGQYRSDIKSLIAKDPRFESIKERGAEEHVLQHILDTFSEDGEVLTVEQAAQEVEDEIVEEAMSMAKLKKVQAKLIPPPKATLPPPQQKTQPQIRTLTQQMTSTPTKTSAQFQHLSPKERLAQAISKAQKPS